MSQIWLSLSCGVACIALLLVSLSASLRLRFQRSAPRHQLPLEAVGGAGPLAVSDQGGCSPCLWLATLPRGWLCFLGACYVGSASGCVVLEPLEMSQQLITLVQWGSLLLYCCVYAPALHAHLLSLRPVDAAESLYELFLAEASGGYVAPLSATRRSPTSPAGSGADSSSRRSPTGVLLQQLLASLPAGVHIIAEREIVYGRLLGSGGFADVYKATWIKDRGSYGLTASGGGAGSGGSGSRCSCAGGAANGGGSGGGSGSGSNAGGSGCGAGAPREQPQLQQSQSSSGEPASDSSGGACAGEGPVLPQVRLAVAVKQLHAAPQDTRAMRSFCQEVGLMGRLSHPNLVRLYGATVSPDGSLGIVTELLPRASVFALLHPRGARGAAGDTPPPLPLVWRLLRGCARGMAYLHSLNPPIIHRDLKSQNLLLAEDYTLKVADFGLACEYLRSDHSQAMSRVGSVQWAAPEVLLGEAYSHKCDLWSFGVVCWELLTAAIPFHGLSEVTVATKVALDGMRLPVPTGAPRPLLRLMVRR